MTAATLKSQTIKDLARLAKRAGVSGWHNMRKDQLVRAILRRAAKPKPTARGATARETAAAKKSLAQKSTAAKPKTPVLRTNSAARSLKPIQSDTSNTDKSDGFKANGHKANVISKSHDQAKPPAVSKTAKAARIPLSAGKATPDQHRAALHDQQKKKILKKLEQAKTESWQQKNLALPVPSPAVAVNGQHPAAAAKVPLKMVTAAKTNWPAKDRLVVIVRGPYWLHATWDLTPGGVQRAQAALGQDWHAAKPILRIITLSTAGSGTSSERISRDIPIHGGVKNWYIDVNNPPQSYRVEIGYLTAKGRFFCLTRSNMITTPPAQIGDSLDAHWGDIAADCEKIYALSGGYNEGNDADLQALFEERLRRPMNGSGTNGQISGSDSLLPRDRRFKLEVDAEILIQGTAAAGAHVAMRGEPIKVHPDGSFSVRTDFPNRRQVIPIVAISKDGVQQRTVVLAVERNTKSMEPTQRDSTGE